MEYKMAFTDADDPRRKSYVSDEISTDVPPPCAAVGEVIHLKEGTFRVEERDFLYTQETVMVNFYVKPAQ